MIYVIFYDAQLASSLAKPSFKPIIEDEAYALIVLS